MPKQKKRRKMRHRLLLYDRFFGRYRIFSFLIFAGLLVSWFAVTTQLFTLPFINISGLFLSGAILFFIFWLFTVLGPLRAFAQTEENYLLLQTPIYRLRIPYQLIINTRPVEVRKIFPPLKSFRKSTQLDQAILESYSFSRGFTGTSAL